MSPFILLPVYIAVAVYAGWMTDVCLRRWPRSAGKARGLRKFWVTPYVMLTLLPVAGAFLPDSPVKFALQAAGNVWLGFYLYFGGILLVSLVLVTLARLVTRGRLMSAEAGVRYGVRLWLALGVSLVLLVYGLIHAQNTVVERFDVPVEKHVEGMDGMKVVLLGDLHLSVNSSLNTTKRMVELVNAEDADLVVIAGDIFTSSYRGLQNPDAYAEALRGMKARYGVYAVYGNHDVEETLFGGFPISPISQAFRSRDMEAFFRDCNFEVLYDDTVLIGGAVQLVGRIDGEKAGDGTTNRKSPAELLKDVDQSLPVLVLEHEPKEFKALKEAGADVALCGHTHAGQIFPGNLVVPLFNENAWGYAVIRELDTVVTAGVGYYGPPMRVGTNSEVTVVNLHFTGAA